MTARLSAVIHEVHRPGSRRVGQGARFLIAGGLVALIYLSVTTCLADVVGLPFQAALAVGFATAICAHFCLQRFFVWVDERGYALPLRVQLSRYLAVVVVQYGSTAAITALLPPVLHVSPTAVYIPWTLFVSAVNFVLFATGIFHAKQQGGRMGAL